MGQITKKLRFKGSPSIKISVESVPVGNMAAYKDLLGDETADEFVNTVKLGENYPARPWPNSVAILTKEWAESFAAKVNETPKPLYLRGHEDEEGFKMRALPFGYVVGAKVVDEETLALRNAFKPAESPEAIQMKKDAMREIKAGLLSTSTGDYSKIDTSYDEDERLTTFKIVESINAQSNALVEHDQTGSDASIVSMTFKGGLPAEDDNKPKQEDYMNPQEAINLLANQIQAGKLQFKDVAEDLGIERLTDDHKLKLKKFDEVTVALGGDVDVYLARLEEDKKATFKALKESSLKAKFKQEEVLELAEDLFSIEEGGKEEIDAEVERIANKKSVQTLMGSKVDESQYKPAGNESSEEEFDGVLKF